MNEVNYLVFLLNNKLSEHYSIRDLKSEVKNRLAELLRGEQGKLCSECERIMGTNRGCVLCDIFNDAYCVEDVE